MVFEWFSKNVVFEESGSFWMVFEESGGLGEVFGQFLDSYWKVVGRIWGGFELLFGDFGGYSERFRGSFREVFVEAETSKNEHTSKLLFRGVVYR